MKNKTFKTLFRMLKTKKTNKNIELVHIKQIQ